MFLFTSEYVIHHLHNICPQSLLCVNSTSSEEFSEINVLNNWFSIVTMMISTLASYFPLNIVPHEFPWSLSHDDREVNEEKDDHASI